MNHSPPQATIAAVVGHIDDAASMDAVCAALAAIHGESYSFRVARWQDAATLSAPAGRQHFYFVMQSDNAHIRLDVGQRVRGVPNTGPYQRLEEHWGEVTAAHEAELWPGDVLCVDAEQHVAVNGKATCFQAEAEATAYPLPTVAFLRHLRDYPGGCAAYPGAFRREALPPMRAEADAADQRGPNRVNEHTLDMRFDRTPQPQPHHHGPVAIEAGSRSGGVVVNHSETALVLPRAIYDLPPIADRDNQEMGRVVIYRQPTVNPADTEIVPVRPGSVVVTPATTDGVVGHRFDNAFAMLVAIPGFVSPHASINDSN